MEEFEKELKLLKAKAKLVENFNEQVLSQRNEQEQLRQDLHQFHLDFFGILNAKMKEFNKRALYQHSKFKLLSKLESKSIETTEKEENVRGIWSMRGDS